MNDIISPARIEWSMQEKALRQGHLGRFISPFTSESSLLPSEHFQIAVDAYGKPEKSAKDWVVMAAALGSWNAYHHQMRQILPADWVDEELFANAVTNACTTLPQKTDDGTRFDHRLTRDARGVLLHARIHVMNRDAAWHVCWGEIMSKERTSAMLCAVLHSAKKCFILSLTTGEVVQVSSATSDEAVVDAVLSDE